MTIGAHLETFAGLPVRDYSMESGLASGAGAAYRLAIDYQAHEDGQKFEDLLAAFTADAACPSVQALLIGDWGGCGEGDGSEPVVEALVNVRDRLPNLRALFLGEITFDESEISWINQSDVSPLLTAFPQLEELCVRGGNSLSLGRPRHANLRKLVIETGGMSADIVREVASADLPRLEHLELWLGDPGYGHDVTVADIEELLASPACQNLTYLGFRNDCEADATAATLAAQGLPPKVKTLDLSLGALSDEGAKALTGTNWISSLQKLDMHHHYASPLVIALLKKLVREVDASDPKEPDDWGDGEMHRYVAVSE